MVGALGAAGGGNAGGNWGDWGIAGALGFAGAEVFTIGEGLAGAAGCATGVGVFENLPPIYI